MTKNDPAVRLFPMARSHYYRPRILRHSRPFRFGLPGIHVLAMRTWNTLRAAAYGGGIGLVAALIKSFAPWSEPQSGAAIARELIGASLAFALLCGLAAALRNFILRRMTGSESG
jgi:hypothetical protein